MKYNVRTVQASILCTRLFFLVFFPILSFVLHNLKNSIVSCNLPISPPHPAFVVCGCVPFSEFHDNDCNRNCIDMQGM